MAMRRPNVFAAASLHENPLDRAHLLRQSQEDLQGALAHPEARVHLVWRSKSLVVPGEPKAAFVEPRRLGEFLDEVIEHALERLLFLGVQQETPTFALDVSHVDDPTGLTDALGGEFSDLRQLGAILPSEDANLMAYARALATWHHNHRHCGRCGTRTQREQGGHLRKCTNPDCGQQGFPRTDPAVIMLVHDGEDRCLLGRQASWPSGVMSTLAGFVEPGESLEMAVAREVEEEAGIRVLEAEYHSSQPWPFPLSIMLGFWARATYAPVSVDPGELEEARWFTRDELLQAKAMRELRLPPPMSIARRLVDDWLSNTDSRRG